VSKPSQIKSVHAKLMRFVLKHRAEHGYGPLVSEIAEHLGVSDYVASHHVASLRKAGLLVGGLRRRELRVSAPAWALRGQANPDSLLLLWWAAEEEAARHRRIADDLLILAKQAVMDAGRNVEAGPIRAEIVERETPKGPGKTIVVSRAGETY